MALPKSLDAEKRTILVGFKDGTVRALSRCSDGWKLLSAIKPHKVTSYHRTLNMKSVVSDLP